jgi:hypothetical protein
VRLRKKGRERKQTAAHLSFFLAGVVILILVFLTFCAIAGAMWVCSYILLLSWLKRNEETWENPPPAQQQEMTSSASNSSAATSSGREHHAYDSSPPPTYVAAPPVTSTPGDVLYNVPISDGIVPPSKANPDA